MGHVHQPELPNLRKIPKTSLPRRGTSRSAVPATRSEEAAVNYMSEGQHSRRVGCRVPEQITIEGNGGSGIELVLLIPVEIDSA